MWSPLLSTVFAGVVDGRHRMEVELDVIHARRSTRFTVRLLHWLIEGICSNTQVVYKAMCERHSLSYRPFEFWVALCTGFEQLVVLNKSVVAHRILPAPASKLILKWYEDQCPEPCDFTCEKQTSIKCACSHSGSKSRAYFWNVHKSRKWETQNSLLVH